MLNGPALLDYIPTSADADFTAVMTQVFDKMIPIALLIVIVISSIEIIKTLVGLFQPNRAIVSFTKK